MRLPRRVPWASIAELDHLCALIYTDEDDLDAKVLAIQRLSAWRAVTQLPHALEATLALLAVVVQDRLRDTAPSHGQFSLSIRQSYSAAIIRLVNGLVDPLQLGTYARSIASIAAQIGLPAWLVELRHAATHEDLPSIDLLRTGARESLSWLLHNYFLPALASPVVPTSQPHQRPTLHPNLPPLLPLLTQYKSLLKITTRDTSLRTQYKSDTAQALRAIQRWVGSASVAASNNVVGDDDRETRDRWAVDRLCDGLIARGAIVPVSAKKRALPHGDKLTPPKELLSIWSPLLTSLQTTFPSLPYILSSRISAALLTPPPPNNNDVEGQQDTTSGAAVTNGNGGRGKDCMSYDMCLAAWAVWLVDTFAVDDNNNDDEDTDLLRREDLVATLISGLGTSTLGVGRPAAEALLQSLCSDRPHLQGVTTTLLPITRSDPMTNWTEGDTTLMDERLKALLSAVNAHSDSHPAIEPQQDLDVKAQHHDADTVVVMDVGDESSDLPSGWRMVDVAVWKPCPIGVYCHA